MGLKIEDRNLLDSFVGEVKRGVELINTTEDIAYTREEHGSGSVGGQFRHILDFALALIRGFNDGRVDYNDRERDVRVEREREWAINRFEMAIEQLCAIDQEKMGKIVMVRSEVETRLWLPSSLYREVEFVHSHTVHHHALIAQKLEGYGLAVTEGFGVAPSTLRFWAQGAG